MQNKKGCIKFLCVVIISAPHPSPHSSPMTFEQMDYYRLHALNTARVCVAIGVTRTRDVYIAEVLKLFFLRTT